MNNKLLILPVIALAITISVIFLLVPQEERKIQSFDNTYKEINSKLQKSLEKRNISMSTPITFSKDAAISKYCSFFDDQQKQSIIKYCTSTELKNESKEFMGNIHLIGKPSSPMLVIGLVQVDPFMSSLDSVKIVFDTMVIDVICDCWAEQKPDGFDSIDSWIDAMRDFHTSGSTPNSKSKILSLDGNTLQMELTTNKDGYLWKIFLSE
ncbi:MAG: hypothetical protein GWN01_06580 [Nitrosopumilaceae archaeon]|nr:hypothetical protein [Nitrosopumilaceae archaeon]NIU86988.1 hypothetical protein [Nitrosopumilaceae archaeon]NIV66452.1 hypothetical protein [Nitrosopumilaceae archaeon]NIX61204.1 hypothetical protein [Nitrosopumilaceae archaeon]